MATQILPGRAVRRAGLPTDAMGAADFTGSNAHLTTTRGLQSAEGPDTLRARDKGLSGAHLHYYGDSLGAVRTPLDLHEDRCNIDSLILAHP